MMVGGLGTTVVTVGEDVGTLGVGIADDPLTLGIAAGLFVGGWNLFRAGLKDNPKNLNPSLSVSSASERNIGDLTNPSEWPENPDEWVPPPGVLEEPKAKEGSEGKHRQWKDQDGNIVRRWDSSGREAGKQRGEHWHDQEGNHILPGGELDN